MPAALTSITVPNDGTASRQIITHSFTCHLDSYSIGKAALNKKVVPTLGTGAALASRLRRRYNGRDISDLY